MQKRKKNQSKCLKGPICKRKRQNGKKKMKNTRRKRIGFKKNLWGKKKKTGRQKKRGKRGLKFGVGDMDWKDLQQWRENWGKQSKQKVLSLTL